MIELSRYPTVETIIRVRYAETDQSGIVYNAHYLIWCELGRGEYFWQRGGDYAKDVEASGFTLPVVEAQLRYLAPARYGEMVSIRTTIKEIKSREVVFAYEIRNAGTGQPLCTAWTRHFCVNRSGKVATIPPEIRAKIVE